MDIRAGTHLGPYEILAPIGRGGMGDVFRARDTRLERIVAIKILRLDSIADSTRRSRLMQEARAASVLNHPNIVTLHDISSDGGVDFLVMEFVPGRPMQELIRPEGMPLADVLHFGVQLASGLAAAHAAKIVHRDIKPANIMITPDRQVKILDFGVAKLTHPIAQMANETRTQLTSPGTVIGTLSYMSPEQTRGEEADGRSDVFSLGVVLYEAATGQLPFQGQSALAVMHEIATVEPKKASTVSKQVPASLDSLLSRALAKDRRDRFESAEFRDQLHKLKPVETGRLIPSRQLVGYAVAAMLALGLGGWWVSRRQAGTASRAAAPEKVTIFTGGGVESGPSGDSSPALSSDGKLLAFIRNSQVWVKLLPSGEPTQLTHDRSPKFDPAFSPDGARIAYSMISANNSWDTWVVPALGGEAHLWLSNASGLHWTGPQTLMFSEIKAGIHMAVVAATSSRADSRDIYVPPEIRGMAHRSYLSPDGKRVLLAEMDRGSWLPCRVVPLDGNSRGDAVGPPNGQCTAGAWAPDGRWMYLISNAGGSPQLWRQQYPKGTPEQLTFGPTETRGVAVAPDGQSVVTSIGSIQHSIAFHDEGGDRTITTQGDSIFPAWGDGFPTSVFSTDGSKLYYLQHSGVTRAFGGGEIWVHDFTSDSNQSLLPDVAATSFDLSTDDKSIVFAALDKDQISRIWISPMDRRTPPRRIMAGEGMGPVFGDEGEIYFRGPEGAQSFVFAVNPDSGIVRKLITEPSVDTPAVSPDRKWVVVTIPVDASGTNRVKAFPMSGGKSVVLCQRCFFKWSRDQKALFVSLRTGNVTDLGETIVLPLSGGQAFPKLPDGGLTAENVRSLPGVKMIGATGVFPGIHASQYAYVNSVSSQNLYRISLSR